MLLNLYMKVNISLLQLNIIAGAPEKNFSNIVNALKNLPEEKLHYALLPELWSSGYSYSNIDFCAKYTQDNIYKISDIAKEKNIKIIGTVPWLENGKLYNRSLFISNSGKIEHYYNKIHLFKPLNEDKYFTEGNKITIIKEPVISALTICYDLRFPELFRKLILQDVKIIFLSAQWPLSRINHWKVLNIARAIENQIFIVSCNRTGNSLNIDFGGNSMIVAPDGQIIKQLGNNEQIFTCNIDLYEIKKNKNLFDIKNDIKIKNI